MNIKIFEINQSDIYIIAPDGKYDDLLYYIDIEIISKIFIYDIIKNRIKDHLDIHGDKYHICIVKDKYNEDRIGFFIFYIYEDEVKDFDDKYLNMDLTNYANKYLCLKNFQ